MYKETAMGKQIYREDLGVSELPCTSEKYRLESLLWERVVANIRDFARQAAPVRWDGYLRDGSSGKKGTFSPTLTRGVRRPKQNSSFLLTKSRQDCNNRSWTADSQSMSQSELLGLALPSNNSAAVTPKTCPSVWQLRAPWKWVTYSFTRLFFLDSEYHVNADLLLFLCWRRWCKEPGL